MLSSFNSGNNKAYCEKTEKYNPGIGMYKIISEVKV